MIQADDPPRDRRKWVKGHLPTVTPSRLGILWAMVSIGKKYWSHQKRNADDFLARLALEASTHRD